MNNFIAATFARMDLQQIRSFLIISIANADVSKAVTAFGDVYMEIGMKAGARLICQLLFPNE